MELPEATRIRLKTQHLVIDELLNKLTKEQCDLELVQGKWTVRQHLAHLVRYQHVFYERTQTIMSTFNAVFSPYVAEDDEEFHKVVQLPVPELLIDLHAMRKTINSFYFNLDSGELSRKGKHTELGNFSIALWAEFFMLHEAHHIFSIFSIGKQLANRGDINAEQDF